MTSRILVVDDDPALAEMLTIVLRGEGFDTAVVGDGTGGAAGAAGDAPDLVLLDLMLPGDERHRRVPGDPRRVRACRSSC